MRSSLYHRCGLQSDDPTLTTQAANDAVNAAMHLIEAEQDWPWLSVRTSFTTEAGTDLYGTPPDWARTTSLRIASFPTFNEYQVDDLDDMFDDSTVGQPYAWAADADRLLLRPTPDGVYTIVHRYVRQEPDLTSDTQSPLMPAKFHAAIVDAAAWQALGGDREEGRAGACFQAYTNWLAKMRDDGRRSSKPGRIRSRPGGWL